MTDLDAWLKHMPGNVRLAVSQYGATNFRELMAEIWSEYSTSGSAARAHIVQVGNIMKRVAEERSR